MKRSIICSVFILLFLQAIAQPDSTVQKAKFKLGVFYNSGLNYYGRTDSLRSSGVFPVAELWFNENFYITAAPVFVNNESVNMDYAGTVATAGYMFTSDDKKWLGNFYAVKPFYENNAQLVQSALKAQGAFTVSRLTKVLNVTAGGDVKLSDQVDFGVTGGIDHIFRKQFNKTVLVIDPSAYIFAGTQKFANTYYKKNNFLIFPGIEQQVTENVNKFNILAYEFSVPMILAKGKFQLLVTPSYIIPQNLIVIENRPDLSERGKEMLYVTVGGKVVF